MAERISHIFSCPDVFSRLAAAAGAALVSWKQAGVGAALRTLLEKLQEYVCVEDFASASDPDDTLRIQRAATQILARGGGTLWFRHGKTYTVWTDNAQSVIINLSGARGVTIEGNGAHIVSARTVPANGNSILIYCAPINGLIVRNLKFTGTSNTTLPVVSSEGERFLNWATASTNILVENVEIRNCLNGPQCIGDNGKNRGITIRNMYCERVFYPLSLWCTDDVVADYTAIECGRAYFPTCSNGYGCNNHDITIYSVRGYGDVEVLFGLSAIPNASLTTDKKNELTNIRVRYKSPGKAASAGLGGSSALVQFGLQQLTAVSGNAANTGKFNISNIDIQIDVNGLDVNGGTASQPYRIFNITKHDATGSSDATTRGYTIDNVRLSGICRNWQNAFAGGGIILFDTETGAANWTGEQAKNILIKDLVVLNSGASANVPFTVNGQPSVSGSQFLTIENVAFQGDYSEANCATANIAHRAFAAANLDASDRRVVSWTPIGNNVTFASAVGSVIKEGRKVTAFFSVTWPATADGNAARVTNLPFTCSADIAAQGGFISFTDMADITIAASSGNAYAQVYSTAGGAHFNSALSGKRIVGAIVYYV